MFPKVKLRLRYSEPAMGVEGKLVLAGGVEVFHRFRNIFQPNEWVHSVPE